MSTRNTGRRGGVGWPVISCAGCGSSIPHTGQPPLPVRTSDGITYHAHCWAAKRAAEQAAAAAGSDRPPAQVSDLYGEEVDTTRHRH